VVLVAQALPHGPLPLIALRIGETLVRQAEASPGLWRIQSGLLKETVVTAAGEVFALDLLGPGDAVGWPPDVLAPAEVRALRPCRVRPIHGARETTDALAERARWAVRLAEGLARRTVLQRLEDRLEDLARRFGHPVPGGRVVPFTLTQDDLAALTGTTRESVNRALAELARRDRVRQVRRGRYLVRGPSPSEAGPGRTSPTALGRSSRAAEGSGPASWRSRRLHEAQ
jgi:CRP-like cAMP-binding protein